MGVGPDPPSAGVPPPPYPLSRGMRPEEERTWAMAAHLLGIVSSCSYLGFIGPLIVWVVKKDESAFVDDQAREALNFQLLVLIAGFACMVAIVLTCGLGLLVALPVILVIPVANLVFCVIAGVAANSGQAYRYPLNWRLIK